MENNTILKDKQTIKKVFFTNQHIVKDPVIKATGVEQEHTIKELVLNITDEEQAEKIVQALKDGGVSVQSLYPEWRQRKDVSDVSTGNKIPQEEERQNTTVITDIGASEVRTFAVYPDGQTPLPLFAGGLTQGADLQKKIIEKDRKGYAIYNNSAYKLYIGEHYEADRLQKDGFVIPANSGFSDALFNANLNCIADATAGANHIDVRVYITSI